MKSLKKGRTTAKPFSFRLVATITLLVSLSINAALADGFTFTPSDEPNTVLHPKITGMPHALKVRAFDAYTEVFTKLKSCSAMNSHEDERIKILNKMRTEKIHLAGDKTQFASTCESYEALASKSDIFGYPNPFKNLSIMKLTLNSPTDSFCFALTPRMSSDLGGAIPHDWIDAIDIGTRSGRNRIDLTPMSFAETDGLVSWYLLEYLLDRYTYLNGSSGLKLARDCLIQKRD